MSENFVFFVSSKPLKGFMPYRVKYTRYGDLLHFYQMSTAKKSSIICKSCGDVYNYAMNASKKIIIDGFCNECGGK